MYVYFVNDRDVIQYFLSLHPARKNILSLVT